MSDQASSPVPVVDPASAMAADFYGSEPYTVTDTSFLFNRVALNWVPPNQGESDEGDAWLEDPTSFTSDMDWTFGPLITAHAWSLRYVINALSIDTVVALMKNACTDWTENMLTFPEFDPERQKQFVIEKHGDSKFYIPLIAIDCAETGLDGHQFEQFIERQESASTNEIAAESSLTGAANVDTVGAINVDDDDDEPRVKVHTVKPSKREIEAATTHQAAGKVKKGKKTGR